MFTKYATRQPRLDFRHRLVFQQPADFPVNAGNPLRDLLQRTADIAQAQQMLRAAIQAEHRARHELDTLQAQPLPEQNSVHIVRDLHSKKHAARLLRIRQGQMPCVHDRKAVFLRQRQQLPTFALAPADIRRALEIRHRVVKIKGRLIEHGAHSVHIRPIRQQRDGHCPRTGALEAMQRDRIAGILGEHDRILADKRLADEVDALPAAVDDKNILIRGRDAARGQMLPQRLRVGG